MEAKSLFSQSEKPIGISSDHAGFELKSYIIALFEEKGIPYKDYGTNSIQSVDYPDFAHPLANAVLKGECYPGIAICGSGNGINMALNRHKGIRSALCWIPEIASLARMHNDANILTLPGRFLNQEETYNILVAFLTTTFEGGRHQGRVDKIECE